MPPSPPVTPPNGPPKINFLNGLTLSASVLWYQQILNRQIFWHSLGVPPPRGPPKWTPQKSIFSTTQFRMPVFYDISRDLIDKYFDIVWGCHPPGDPPKWTPQKSIFWMAQLRVPVCFDISRCLTDKYFDIVWGCHLPENPPNGPLKN